MVAAQDLSNILKQGYLEKKKRRGKTSKSQACYIGERLWKNVLYIYMLSFEFVLCICS